MMDSKRDFFEGLEKFEKWITNKFYLRNFSNLKLIASASHVVFCSKIRQHSRPKAKDLLEWVGYVWHGNKTSAAYCGGLYHTPIRTGKLNRAESSRKLNRAEEGIGTQRSFSICYSVEGYHLTFDLSLLFFYLHPLDSDRPKTTKILAKAKYAISFGLSTPLRGSQLSLHFKLVD